MGEALHAGLHGVAKNLGMIIYFFANTGWDPLKPAYGNYRLRFRRAVKKSFFTHPGLKYAAFVLSRARKSALRADP